MKFSLPLLGLLLAALGGLPSATSYAMLDRRPEAGNPAPFIQQQRREQAASMANPNAADQARRNQAVLEGLDRPPVGWAHYDHPPALLATTSAAAPEATAKPSGGNWWLVLIGALLLGAGIAFAATLFMPRQAAAPPRPPPKAKRGPA